MDVILAILLFGVPAALGLRATWHLWQLVFFDGESRRQLLLIAMALISTVITAAALWYGALAARRLLGFDPLPWATPVSLVIAGIVLLIPAAIEAVVSEIAKS